MEADWPAIILLSFVTGVAMYIGRVWFKRWFNPLSTYSAVWGFCLASYELRLIQYYPLSQSAWFYILLAWFSFYLGAGLMILVRGVHKPRQINWSETRLELLRRSIIGLSVLAGVGSLFLLRAVKIEFGSLWEAIFVYGNNLYQMRSAGELSWVPYLGTMSYPACCLAGVYTARKGRPTIVGSIPFFLTVVNGVFSMARAGVIIAAVLFLTSYLSIPRGTQFRVKRKLRRLGLIVGISILAIGAALVSLTRGLSVGFPGSTPALEELSQYFPILPSLYSNLSAPPVAFSQYLDNPRDNSAFWGRYTFAPIVRVLSRLGLAPYVSYYEENYYTPVPMNTATYLKNVHADFGPAGIFLFPYLMGAVATLFALRVRETFSLTTAVLLAHLYVAVVFSFATLFMQLGYWFISALVSTCAAVMIERRENRRASIPGLDRALETASRSR